MMVRAVTANDGENIVKVVGYTPGKAAYCFQSLGLPQLFF